MDTEEKRGRLSSAGLMEGLRTARSLERRIDILRQSLSHRVVYASRRWEDLVCEMVDLQRELSAAREEIAAYRRHIEPISVYTGASEDAQEKRTEQPVPTGSRPGETHTACTQNTACKGGTLHARIHTVNAHDDAYNDRKGVKLCRR